LVEERTVTKRNKAIALVFFGITLFGLIVLATGISDLQFRPGEPFSLAGRSERDSGEIFNMDWLDIALTFARVFLGLAVILMPFFVIYLFFSRNARRDLLRLLATIVPLMVILLILSRLPQSQFFEEEIFGGNGPGLGEEIVPAPLAEFVTEPPTWVVNLVGVVIALILTGLITMIVINRKRKPVGIMPFERMALEAEGAIRDLYAGRDLRETILRCYRDMSLVLDQERGIRRSETMTTHEFEQVLQGKGLPDEPIHQLTLLFEDVRYGNLNPGEADETRAISSLGAIVSALRSKN
jgi:hypothetical protein